MSEDNTCPICLDDAVDPVSCNHCAATICYGCFERYILTKELIVPCFNDACGLPWSDDFIDEVATDEFRNGALRAHRSKILVDQEMARLPDLQERARRYRIASKVRTKQKPWYVREMLNSYGGPIRSHNAYHSMRDCYYCQNDKHCHALQRQNESDIYGIKALEMYGPGWCHDGPSEGPKLKPKVLRACPGACLGFLGEGGACGLCSKTFCLRCHEELEASGHACNPDIVATIKALAHETKPCPKCRAAIYKIDGCDQMWCTQCQTPFSWATGKEEVGRVHNPHYYEWLRRTKGSVPREPECREGELMRLPMRDASPEITSLIQGLHRTVAEKIQYIREPRFTEEPLNRAGIKYLAGEIKKAEWARRVYLEKRARARDTGEYQIMRAFTAAATDILNGYAGGATDAKQTIRGVADLIIYIEGSLDRLYERYFYTGNGLHVIPDNWYIIIEYSTYNKLEEICGRTFKSRHDICCDSFARYVFWALEQA